MSKVLYILGSGRSGSTVVERVLNSSAAVVGVGEIHALWRLPIADLLCSCGQRVPDCSFWQTVLSHAGIGRAEILRLAQLEREVVRNTYLVKIGFSLQKIRKDERLAEFAELQRRLFAGVRVAGQGDVVLDSSKAGPRAWLLAATMAPVILHMYRGAEDVIASWRRPKFEPSTNAPMKKPAIGEAALDWIKAEQAARSLAKVAEVARIDYRTFSETPKAALQAALNGRFPSLVESVAWKGETSVRPAEMYHSVLGNPDRFSRSDIDITPQKASDRSRFGMMERILIRSVGKGLERAFP